VNEFEVEYEIG